ncbi:AAA family ATPase [Nocardiopsis sp. MG754419]|uniref:AAA family ATPase n=1 Tax=Nocardiopsis sp. MG754419 TaxID=2259865 RepID=UPI001BA63607|nr:AAA family ATPase [Nocardiopsis sp. MG754419]MBR8744347.1 ATPase [Nocardiopsis sp. MG754419]
MDHLVVVTGGPGSGKTTLIDHLAGLGHGRTVEAGRAIIRDRRAIGAPVPDRRDPDLFAELMLSWDMRSHREASGRRGLVFCDRGVPDMVGYFLDQGREVPAHVREAARLFRYHHRVFLAPPWPEIYAGDTERHQSPEEAERTFEAMRRAYPSCGYATVLLPRASVAERARFVLDVLATAPAPRPL